MADREYTPEQKAFRDFGLAIGRMMKAFNGLDDYVSSYHRNVLKHAIGRVAAIFSYLVKERTGGTYGLPDTEWGPDDV